MNGQRQGGDGKRAVRAAGFFITRHKIYKSPPGTLFSKNSQECPKRGNVSRGGSIPPRCKGLTDMGPTSEMAAGKDRPMGGGTIESGAAGGPERRATWDCSLVVKHHGWLMRAILNHQRGLPNKQVWKRNVESAGSIPTTPTNETPGRRYDKGLRCLEGKPGYLLAQRPRAIVEVFTE